MTRLGASWVRNASPSRCSLRCNRIERAGPALELHQARELLSGTIVFPWSDAEKVLRGYAVAAASAPDQLTTMAGIFPMPDGTPSLMLAPVWTGDHVEGDHAEGGEPAAAAPAPPPPPTSMMRRPPKRYKRAL